MATCQKYEKATAIIQQARKELAGLGYDAAVEELLKHETTVHGSTFVYYDITLSAKKVVTSKSYSETSSSDSPSQSPTSILDSSTV